MSRWVNQIRAEVRAFYRDTQYEVDEIRVHPLILFDLRAASDCIWGPVFVDEGGWTFEGVRLVPDQAIGTVSVSSVAHQAAVRCAQRAYWVRP